MLSGMDRKRRALGQLYAAQNRESYTLARKFGANKYAEVCLRSHRSHLKYGRRD